MGILVLSRQHPAMAPFDVWLGDAVKDARLLTATERRDAFARQGFAEIVSFDNYEECSLVEFEALQLAARWRIDHVVATSETDILRAGRIRTHLGLPGQSGDSALAFRNKLDMKRRLAGRARRVRIPEFHAVEEGYDVLAFVERHGYPVIVKPIDGFASIGTTVIRDAGDLRGFLARRFTHGLEIERFIDGAQYHIDGLVLGGELVLCWPSRYLGDCLSFTRGGFTASQMLAADNPIVPRLSAAAAEILEILPTPASTAFHLELFETADGALHFCEIASRTGGGMINASMEHAFGINLTEIFVRSQAGQTIDVAAIRERARTPRRLLGWGLVAPQAGVFEGYRQESPELPFVVSHEWMMAKGTRSQGAVGSTDRVAGFIVAADPDQSCDDRLRTAWQWTCDNAIWAADRPPT
jgi:hypothetical protein